ncbi:hypothetical protein EIL87_14135 [Saccharopolyspora rhizosphaerae]|uniref:PH domain-containing protein n=1 Tax=Saccharopolyspora rhizosphaerae TaxID=2492662 RepID=A0A426JSR0_9PSEU|nr:hypothetical protein [Saccharopolyspora rhizosphaerae]RRO16187.1 hypothetical protein EIL87_14135 [Saccharopolyspora rhizosphaerae]
MRTELVAPSDSAKVVRYSEGFGCLGGGLFLAVVGSAFLYLALYPEEAVKSPASVAAVMGWFFTVLVFVPGVLMLIAGLVVLLRPERVHLDERGIWLRRHGEFELISWTEVRALHGRFPQPKVKDDRNSKPTPAALLIQPADNGFLARHPQLADRENPEVPRLALPGRGAVQRLTQAIGDLRPDLLS